jgi:hypothetical protein
MRVNVRGLRGTVRRLSEGVLATERGDSFSTTHGWVMRYNAFGGSPLFDQRSLDQRSPAHNVIQWFNDGSILRSGTAEYFVPYATLTTQFDQEGVYEDAHTVHLRILQGTNDSSEYPSGQGGVGLGPATVIWTAGAGVAGNCYGLRAWYDNVGGKSYIEIGFHAVTGLFQSFGTPVRAEKVVGPGDVLSLSYRYDTSGAASDLMALFNGVEVASTSVAGGYRMSTVTGSGLPGLIGFGVPARGGNSYGDMASEWWVTKGYGESAYSEIPSVVADRTGDVKVQLMSREVHVPNASSEPVARYLLSKEITDLQFTVQRIGGPSSCQIIGVVQDWQEGTTPDPTQIGLYEPFADYWSDKEWHGGELRILVSYSTQGRRKLTSDSEVDEVAWNGRIRELTYDRATRAITILGEGWIAALDEAIVPSYRATASIRDAVKEVLGYVTRGAGVDHEFPIADVQLTALKSILDTRQKWDFLNVTVRSALQTILATLPGMTGLGGAGMVWGVNSGSLFGRTYQRPVFYLLQALHHYETDSTTPPSTAHFPTLDADASLTYRRIASFGDMRNDVTVYGAETSERPTPSDLSRVKGRAQCKPSIDRWGRKQEVQTESDVVDGGLAARVAQAIVKRKASLGVHVDLKMTYDLGDTMSLWHALVPDQPYVAILDRREPDDVSVLRTIGETTTKDYKVWDKMLRRYGDVEAYAHKDDGDSGALLSFSSTGREQNLNKSWMLHLEVHFDEPAGGAGSSYRTIFGRQQSGNNGWGALVWHNTGTGKLYWSCRLGGTNRYIDTGIAVPILTPGNTTVRFTVYRDATGNFHFYDGATLKRTEINYQNDATESHTDDWQFWDGKWDSSWFGAFENFYLYDFALCTWRDSVAEVQAFLNRNTNQRLHRNEGCGIIRRACFNEANTVDTSQFTGFYWDEKNQVKFTYTWTQQSASDEPKLLTTGDRRGWRMGDSSQEPSAPGTMHLKKWGGPLVLVMERVTYRISPKLGTVEVTLRAGKGPADFPSSIAAIKRQAEREAEILARIRQDD